MIGRCEMCGEGYALTTPLCEFCMEQSFWDYQESMVE
jgi:hypothetical protein